jgi:FkbM family methyltransferase
VTRPWSLPVRTIARVVRSDWGVHYRLAVQPDRVTLAGINIHLDERVHREVRRAIYEGWYEQEERTALERTLRPDDRYLELGAGLGFVTACACRIAGAPNVTAYEALSELADLAEQTCALNGFAPAIVNAVLGDEDGVAQFTVHEEFWRSSLSPTIAGEQRTVPMQSLAAVLERLRPTYLMVDIEGGEVALFDHPLPSCMRAVCVETHPEVVGADATQRMLLALMRAGFRLDTVVSGSGLVFLSRSL